jgi:hypothetical protein
MTRETWENATPHQMMVFIGWQHLGLARKQRLYHISLCRHFWGQLPSPVARSTVEAAERFVEGELSLDQLRVAHTTLFEEYIGVVRENGGKRYIHTRIGRMYAWVAEASSPQGCIMVEPTHRNHMAPATSFLRDIFGNRVYTSAFDPRWRTADVLGLARAIYDDRAFERMPILADALMDAGCENEEIIAHCRGDGPHVRGCWVVDLILGKS